MTCAAYKQCRYGYNRAESNELQSIIRRIKLVVKHSMPPNAAAHIDYDELAAEILHRANLLAQCSDEPGRITRLFCSPAMKRAHDLVASWMQIAGMEVRTDAAGNLIGRWGPIARPRVLIGSHLDTVVDAGRYDGVLGVLLGIATVGALANSQARDSYSVEVVAFSEEEGVRFATPFLGSRAIAGTFDQSLLEITDYDGVTMADALRNFGPDPGELSAAAADAQRIFAYIEPHIEQGRLLEQANAPLGVVTSIVGQSRLSLEWRGPGGHAGGVPMHERCDPFVAACQWVAQVDEVAQNEPGLLATVGRVEVTPSVSNCIPRSVNLSLDVRHAQDATRRAAVATFVSLGKDVANDHRVRLQVDPRLDQAAVPMDEALNQALTDSIVEAGFAPRHVASGAGHDAGVMAPHVPSTILLIRSPGGVSHGPEEAVTQDDAAVALQALVGCVAKLADANAHVDGLSRSNS